MSGYIRVLPRDLFNESALLKCLGKLWIKLEHLNDHNAVIVEETVQYFDIVQDYADGSISVKNITFCVKGEKYRLARDLNSQNSWSLWVHSVEDPDFESVEVFDEEGNLTAEMIEFITG